MRRRGPHTEIDAGRGLPAGSSATDAPIHRSLISSKFSSSLFNNASSSFNNGGVRSVAAIGNPYVPLNTPALSDLVGMFDFYHPDFTTDQ